jgi:C-terminal processing protease CtpA/Prc
VGERVLRNHTRDWKIESKGSEKVFAGKLVVLIDSQSASAAEIFARVIQIESRGVLIGDRSSGMVMGAVHSHFVAGTAPPIAAAVSVTEEDLKMRDGKSLEHVGVDPDRTVLPSPQDLASGRDPALAAALAELRIQLTPEQAGKLFPTVWRNF